MCFNTVINKKKASQIKTFYTLKTATFCPTKGVHLNSCVDRRMGALLPFAGKSAARQ